jgi:hypothetical protein
VTNGQRDAAVRQQASPAQIEQVADRVSARAGT